MTATVSDGRGNTAVAAPVAGVWAPICTPLDAEGAIDEGRLVDHAGRLLASGCHGVVLFGTTGEASSFSVDERESALNALAASGVPADAVVVGTGCAAPTDTIRLSAHAIDAGFARLLVVPPFYLKGVPEEGVFRSYTMVIESVDATALRLYLYHIPHISGVPITSSLVARLKDRYGPVVAGLKDSSGDPDGTERFIEAFPDLNVLAGDEHSMLRLLRAGAKGCITATANVNAPSLRLLYDLWRDASPEAGEAQERASAVRKVIERYPRIPALKHLIAVRTDDPPWRQVRPPLVPLDPSEAQSLEDDMAAAAG